MASVKKIKKTASSGDQVGDTSNGGSARVDEFSTPHAHIPTHDARQRFTLRLFDTLWRTYRERVAFARAYEDVVKNAGGSFVNDHIAFRTLAAQQPTMGIVTLARVFEALGYVAANCYQFSDKHLSSLHFQHPHPQFPKLFISELRGWELSDAARKILDRYIQGHTAIVDQDTLVKLARLNDQSATTQTRLLTTLTHFFQSLPWQIPSKKDVIALNKESQFGAWVLVHGYNVNHFTALVNSHQVVELGDIEKTVASMLQAGIPMKTEIEGAPGSKLRQTATEAVVVDVEVMDGTKSATMPWTYAYFEIAERGEITDPDTGNRARFEGFLGPQATQLFEMTRTK